jgi:hypothetical protein
MLSGYIQQILSAPLPDNPDVQQAIHILRDWDLRATEESVGTTVAILMLHFVNESGAVSFNPSMLVAHPVPP